MMKKNRLLILLTVFCAVSLSAQNKKHTKEIIYSTNIKNIEEFLKSSHPDDPRNPILKKRLIKLKNETWMKGKYSPSINQPLKAKHFPPAFPQTDIKNYEEDCEYQDLITESPQEHTDKTLKLLNNLFNNDKTNKEVIVLVRNNSECNLIIRINGKKLYNLAVPAHGENTIVVEKDSYRLSSNVCNIKYEAFKNISKGFILTLKTSEIQPSKIISASNSKSK